MYNSLDRLLLHSSSAVWFNVLMTRLLYYVTVSYLLLYFEFAFIFIFSVSF